MKKQWMIFGIKTEGAEKAEKDIDELGKSAEKSGDKVKDLNDDLDDTGKKSKKVGKEGGKGFGALSKGLKLGATGFKALGTAIAATGVGLLVILIGGLVAKMMKMKVVMDVVEKASAGIGAAFKILADVAIDVGEWLYWAFNSPQEALDAVNKKIQDFWSWLKSLGTIISTSFSIAMKQLKIKFKEAAIATKEFFGLDASELKAEIKSIEGEIEVLRKTQADAKEDFKAPFVAMGEAIKETIDDMKEAGAEAVALKDKQIALRDAQRALNEEYARARAEIADLKKDSDDITLSVEDRIAAAQKAAKIEDDLRLKRKTLLDDEIALLLEEQRIQGENEEITNRISELRIQQQANIEEGLGLQTELMTKVQGLELEREDALKAFNEASKARKDELAGEQAQELEELATFYAEQLLLAEKYDFDTTELLKDQQAEEERLAKKHQQEIEDAEAESNAKRRAEDKALSDSRLQMAGQALGALTALNNAFAKDGEEGAKKAFKRNKALSMSTAIVNTALAVSDALAKDSVAPLSRYVSAAAAGAMGIAQVATIARTKFQSTTTPDQTEDLSGRIEATSQTAQAPPSIDFGFLGQGAGAEGGIRAYVIAENVSNGLQANQKLTDQTTL